MKRFMLGLFCVASLLLGSLAMTGCNTMAGIGQDTKETGEFIGGTPAPDAYHQQARDF